MRGAGGRVYLTEPFSQRFAERRSELTFIIVAGLAGVPLAMTLFETPNRGVEKLIRNKSHPGRESRACGGAARSMREDRLVLSHIFFVTPASLRR